ncbi:histidine--tRNA ligase [Tripterygium wilfordii]|uniref:Histidine--tRNA ligase, cytoplasmic n=1 Tax=Tripterygium wilfordii TaxID=458696 RepID=A0A7J7C1M9_TRIWF|nr:histidine--tRNA ligase, cytoplasmic-like [Tripterygium wilfordii]KAF5728060.1 histidine--tRNA ligase [Tripterygium wilfordii]
MAEGDEMGKSSVPLLEMCEILDKKSAALITMVDAVAALSCEAARADVTAFDTGDAFVNKEGAGVARGMKGLLNGSKRVGKVKSEAIAEIPNVHGRLREVVKSVHLIAKVEFNSAGEIKIDGVAKVVAMTVEALALALRIVGENCFLRTKMNLDSVGDASLRKGLQDLFEKGCPTEECLSNGYRLPLDLIFQKDYVRFVHEVNMLLGIVSKIIVWEAVTAFVALEGGQLNSTNASVEANGGDVKVDIKAQKKKKVVLGKGTRDIVDLINERLNGGGGVYGDDTGSMEKLVEVLLLIFDLKDPEFDGLWKMVKDIVESNETRRLPKLPKGTRDFSKEQMVIREKAFSIITDVFKRHGAVALDTPVFELRETLTGKYGEDSKLIYDLADQGGELCSLRYDLTVPFARYVAMNGITSFKRYQIAKVYRRDNPAKGRYREFYQCDFDIAGQYDKMGPDFEVIKILTELLDELDIGDYEIKLNHRMLLDAMLEICGVPPEKFRTICSSVDKLDKQPFEQIKKEMVEEKGLSVEVADKIGTFVKYRGPPMELLSKLGEEGSKFLENSSSISAMKDLESLFKSLESCKCIDKVTFDLSLARGLDYYTGVVYEAVFKGSTQVGSIVAGGRYDNLIGMYGTKQIPAVGLSLGIERVFVIMEQRQKEQNQTIRATDTQVLVSVLGGEDYCIFARELVNEIWNAKLKAEYIVNKRIMNHIKRAVDSGIPYMVLVGEQELKDGVVKLKNIKTSDESTVPRNRMVEELKTRLN